MSGGFFSGRRGGGFFRVAFRALSPGGRAGLRPVLFFSVPVSFSRSRQGRTREARAGNRGNAVGVAFLSLVPCHSEAIADAGRSLCPAEARNMLLRSVRRLRPAPLREGFSIRGCAALIRFSLLRPPGICASAVFGPKIDVSTFGRSSRSPRMRRLAPFCRVCSAGCGSL